MIGFGLDMHWLLEFGPRCEKTSLQGVRPSKTLTNLLSYIDLLEL